MRSISNIQSSPTLSVACRFGWQTRLLDGKNKCLIFFVVADESDEKVHPGIQYFLFISKKKNVKVGGGGAMH